MKEKVFKENIEKQMGGLKDNEIDKVFKKCGEKIGKAVNKDY